MAAAVPAAGILAMSGSRIWDWLPAVVGVVLAAVAAGVVGWVYSLPPNQRSDELAAASFVVAVAGVFVALWSGPLQTRSSAGPRPDQLALTDIADELAMAVRMQWENEARVRGLNDPDPLPVSWQVAEPDLVEQWDDIVSTARRRREADESGWADDASALAGSNGQLAKALALVPTGRLLVLGGPGAGKTMLLVRLVLDVLDSRTKGGPVPTLVPLSSWNPAVQDLRTWLLDRLVIDYPGLAEPTAASPAHHTWGQVLLSEGLILPILDGLDEIPKAVRGQALAQINESFSGKRIVVSARTDDYRQAVHPPDRGGVKLCGAAGVELCDLDPADVRRYLRRGAGDNSPAPDRWERVLDALGTDSPVGQALRTPLMASLARTIYNPRPGEHLDAVPDPAGLLSFTAQPDVERHLFDAFINAAYQPHPDPTRRCLWRASQARRYLTFLARRLESVTEIAWWELSDHGVTPTKDLRLSPAAFKAKWAYAPAVGLIVFLVLELAVKPAIGIGGGIASTLVCGFAVGLETAPADLTVAINPIMVLARDRSTALKFALVIGPLIGMAVGVIIQLVANPPFVANAGPGIGLVTGMLVGPAAVLLFSFVLQFNLKIGVVAGLLMGTTDWLVSWLLGQLRVGGLQGQLISGLLVGVVGGSLFGVLKTAWWAFTVTRCRLALRRCLPWQLMRFLADAHQRGVLRQSGAIYEFRHIQLQQRLADTSVITANGGQLNTTCSRLSVHDKR